MSLAVQHYIEAKRMQALALNTVRKVCKICVQPLASCYCSQVQPFDPKIEFAILIHPIEQRRRIATGRMSHLFLKSSHLIPGCDYTQDSRVNALIQNPKKQCFILFPGPSAANLTHLNEADRSRIFETPSKEKRDIVIFVIDGTWATARKTMRVSENLKSLPRICFSPAKPSHFRVRQQPKPECYSTLEAIHHTIELANPFLKTDSKLREHDRLLRTFDWLVDQQLAAYDSNTPKLRRTL